MKTAYMLCSMGSLAGFLVGAGCWGVAGSHCGNLEGDGTCAGRGSGMYCNTCRAENDGCSEVVPPEGCHFVGPGQEGSTSILGDTTGTTSPVDTNNVTLPIDTSNPTSEEMSADGTTLALTSESGVTTGPECTSDEECEDPTAPFCGVSGDCVASCSETMWPNASCAGESPDLPVCVSDACVSCDDGLMLIDPTTGSCVSCTEHDQCESGACDIFEGTCFDPERVVEVGGSGGQPSTIAGGLMALEMLEADRRGERRGVLMLHDGGGGGALDFDESATIDAGDYDAVAFIATQPNQSPDWGNSSLLPAGPTLTVTGATIRAYLDHVQLRDNTNGFGIYCDDARVDIRRSRLARNDGAIEALGQCELVVQNSFIGDNSALGNALRVNDVSVTATILYSTLGADGSALLCPNEGPNVDVRNSILISSTWIQFIQEINCPNATLTTNATEAGGLGPMDTNWFFDYEAGDFHLTANAPEGTIVAEWQPGDPIVDIDGDPRYTDQIGRAGADRPN